MRVKPWGRWRRSAARKCRTSAVRMLWRWRAQYRPNRRRRGARVRALIAERRSRRSHCRRSGVWPRGAQVRRTTGWSMKPLSSRKTRALPARRAFFYMRPGLGSPPLDRHLVPLLRPALRLLTAPALAAEDLPDVRGVVGDPEGPGNHRGDPRQGPERGAEAVGGRSLEEQLQQLGALPGRDPGRPPGRRLRPQPVGAAAPDFDLPAADRGGGAADLPGDLAHPEPRGEEGDGPAPPRFQICEAAVWSHA